ncbi:MAG TPA: hypothetical protein VFB99_24435 [Vicinamibacterales bacterium]|nr:hypothetical protein [Vicinamibacterales bacterium]
MTQLGLFDQPAVTRTSASVGDLWGSPSGRPWRVTEIGGDTITMVHEHNGFTHRMTHPEAEWRRQGWRPQR